MNNYNNTKVSDVPEVKYDIDISYEALTMLMRLIYIYNVIRTT